MNKDNANPRVSVIVPVYNASKYLHECLDSVLRQTFSDWELIAIDDGSSDESGGMLDRYSDRDPRIRVFHKKNAGVWAARNDALGKARGDWITFLDSDDAYAPFWMEVAMRSASNGMFNLIRQGVFFGDVQPVGFDSRQGGVMNCVYEDKEAAAWVWQTFPTGGFLWRCFIRKEIIGDCKFLPVINCKEDGIWLLELAPKIKKVCENDYEGYFYRRAEGSLTKKNRSIAQCRAYLLALLSLWKEQKVWIAENGLLDLAKKQLRWCSAHDVVEWIEHRKLPDAGNPSEILAAYRLLELSGAVDCDWNGRGRYRLAFALWAKTGWRWPMVLVYSIICLFRLVTLKQSFSR